MRPKAPQASSQDLLSRHSKGSEDISAEITWLSLRPHQGFIGASVYVAQVAEHREVACLDVLSASTFRPSEAIGKGVGIEHRQIYKILGGSITQSTLNSLHMTGLKSIYCHHPHELPSCWQILKLSTFYQVLLAASLALYFLLFTMHALTLTYLAKFKILSITRFRQLFSFRSAEVKVNNRFYSE